MRMYRDIHLTIFIMIILTVVMLWPMEHPPLPQGNDKLVHLAAFAALSFPIAHTGRVSLLLVVTGASAFGGLIELIQPTFNRSSDLYDWISDILGVIVGIFLGSIYRWVRKH